MVREQEDAVALVRRFNRTVAERIGVLDDSFLGRDRPVGASRLLWEIGPGGADLLELRDRLGMDSGYASRLVRRLKKDGLIQAEPDPADRRRRRLTWTRAGRAEVRELDRRSDATAASLIEQLPSSRRAPVLAAIEEVERSLRASLVEIDLAPLTHPDVVACFARYAEELDARFPDGFDPGVSLPLEAEALTPPAGHCVVARLRGAAIGCCALKLHGDEPAELKRLWVDPDARGLGVARRLVECVEELAAAAGAPAVRLDTNAALTEATELYRSAGFAEVPPFNDEPYADHWFEKRLGG